jgi:hypothetical protein
MVRHNPPKPPPLVELQAQPSIGCAFFGLFEQGLRFVSTQGLSVLVLVQCQKIPDTGAQDHPQLRLMVAADR